MLLRLAVKWTQTVCGEEAAADDFLTGRRKILLEGSLLRQIADLPRGESIAEGDLTFERRYESEQSFDQCRLTGTVLADDAQIVTAVKAEVDIRSDCMPFIAERETAAGKLRCRRQQLSGRLRTLLGLRLDRILRGSGAIQIGCLVCGCRVCAAVCG